MKDQYDFSKAKRGPVTPVQRGKTRITIRIDDDILEWFRARVHAAGGGSYQTLINVALREHMRSEGLEKAIRKVVRDEMSPFSRSLKALARVAPPARKPVRRTKAPVGSR